MQFRIGGSEPGMAIGCGSVVVLLGLILISPVGVVLIKTVGWVITIIGVVLLVMGVFSWMSGSRNRS